MLRGKTSNIRHAFLLLICNFLKKLRTKSNHFFGTSTYIWDTNHHQFIRQADCYLKYCSLNHISYVTGQNPWESTTYILSPMTDINKVYQKTKISDRAMSNQNRRSIYSSQSKFRYMGLTKWQWRTSKGERYIKDI